jgi:hypothetical protein
MIVTTESRTPVWNERTGQRSDAGAHPPFLFQSGVGLFESNHGCHLNGNCIFQRGTRLRDIESELELDFLRVTIIHVAIISRVSSKVTLFLLMKYILRVIIHHTDSESAEIKAVTLVTIVWDNGSDSASRYETMIRIRDLIS